MSIRVFAFPETPDSTIGYAGGDSFRYRLYGVQGHDPTWEDLERDAVALAEPNDRSTPLQIAPAEAQRKLAVWGVFETQGDEDAIAIETTRAGHWSIKARSLELGSDADLILEVLDSAGKILAKQGESGEIREPVFKDQMKTPGKYIAVVRDLHRAFGGDHRYRIEFEEELPSVLGSIAKDVFVGEVGKPIELEIALERTLDCTEEAVLRLEGGIEEIACEPVTSRAGDDSAKKVMLKVTATRACSIPFQVRIDQAGRPEPHSVMSGTHRQPHLWLIVKAAP